MSSSEPVITLTTDRTAYAPPETITVRLVNSHPASVFTTDHQTCCSIITLLRQDNGRWVTAGGCMMGRATRVIEIPAGESMLITLTPGAGLLRPTPWPAGTYRAVFRYSLAREAMGASVTVESAEFTVV